MSNTFFYLGFSFSVLGSSAQTREHGLKPEVQQRHKVVDTSSLLLFFKWLSVKKHFFLASNSYDKTEKQNKIKTKVFALLEN